MKFSEQWLREWVNPQASTEVLVEQLTMAGLEVDGVEAVATDFTGVTVAEILSAEQHPDADKLRVCQVNTGSETVQVVCGAPNAKAGLKVPYVKVGGVLPMPEGKPLKIKKAKLRGVESFGMLCAEQELGMADHSDGLMELPADAPVGEDVRDYLSLDDNIIDVDLTPNRADCFSIRGIARDVGVLNKEAVTEVAIEAVAASIDDTFPIEINAAEDCPRYTGRIIRGVDVSVSTPLWMQEKLRRSGIRSIDPIVDITNYVLLELGQPMHAFDVNLLEGGINVRLAEQGEKLQLLDGQEIELTAGSLVIADHKKPVALAGIMGGAATAVNANTKDILLESAFFAPVNIAGRARSYGLHTDSSLRYERGVDYALQAKASERATQLILEIAGGEAGPIVEVAKTEHLPTDLKVELREARIERLLGLKMPRDEVSDILKRLGMAVTETEAGWQVNSPSWRFDIEIEADLLEELARVYGYNNMPVAPVSADLILKPKPDSDLPLSKIRRQLVARDYQEAITYSFVEPKMQELVCPGQDTVALNNPISADMSVMRTSLWPGLLSAMRHNLNRQQSRVRLFEAGLTFIPEGGTLPKQESMLAGAITGRLQTESWSEDGQQVDFYDIKGDLESVLELGGNADAFSFAPAEHPALHPGQTAGIFKADEQIGLLGAIHPELQKKLDISQTVYLFELKLSAITSAALPNFTELSKFPEVRRDLAILINREVAANEVLAAVKDAAGSELINLRLFDIYEGKGIDPKEKSLALGLTYQHSSRTLNEDEVNASVDTVVEVLQQKFSATLRG